MTPTEIKAARTAAGLTQQQAAALIHCGASTWQSWELGTRKMHPAFWELFAIKTGSTPSQFDSTAITEAWK